MLVDDGRYRTRVWLNSYLSTANLTKDDGSTALNFITAFADPPYPMDMVFLEPKNVDMVFSVGTPETMAKVNATGSIYGYREAVPIDVYAIKKQGIDGNKVRWKADAELRRITETYPSGSYRSIERVGEPSNRDMDGWILFGIHYVLTYERDTT